MMTQWCKMFAKNNKLEKYIKLLWITLLHVSLKSKCKRFFYVSPEFYRHAQYHITTLQRLIRIIHYSRGT